MTDFAVLLKPLHLRRLVLRNRIISTSHAPAYAEGGMPKERYQRYHEEKARGGLAMTMFGGSSVTSPECPASFGQLNVGTDEIVPYFQQFSSRIHKHGAAIMCQISHMGRRSRWDAGAWLPNISSSPVREPEHRSFPKPMEDWDFRRVIRDFGAAARRCKDGGLDGVELSFNALHLIPQFWSPLVNKRNDLYGGSLENRMRLSLEVLEEVRTHVGSDFIVGVRMSGDELIDSGSDFEECLDIVSRLEQSGQVDFFNLMGGNPNDFLNLAVQIGNMAMPVAPFLYLASAVRARVEVPVMQAQKISDLHTAARAVADGHVDLVGMVRPHMADPYIVSKLMTGQADDIRQCVGANYCIDRIYAGGEALCIQNPAMGRETQLPHQIEKSATKRKIVVIGAGPAGLEAARVSAARGHDVVLLEMGDTPGGQILLAQRATWREGLSGITRWLIGQVEKSSVDIRYGTEATPKLVSDLNPDMVVVATGGKPAPAFTPGADLAVTSWDILSGRVEACDNILLFDDHGGHQGPACAEFLVKRGARLEIATPERHLGIEIGPTNHPVHLRELSKAGVVISPDTRLVEAYREANRLIAVLRHVYTLEEEERVVDQIVVEHGTIPVDDLYFALRPLSRNGGEVDMAALANGTLVMPTNNPDGSFDLVRIGDAIASRNIHAAIYDGLRYCKDI